MSSIPRRTLQDLVARYQLEPSLRDIFVEGRFDLRVMQRFARETDTDFAVYEIGSIECTAEQLAMLELPDNARSRSIWLAQMLSQELGHDSQSVRCVADADFDILFDDKWDCGLLLFTDVPSMEVYYFSEPVIEPMLSECVGLNVNCAELFENMRLILRKAFVARGANVKLGWGMSWMSPLKCVNAEAGTCTMQLNFDDFEQRYLNKNQRVGQLREFRQRFSDLNGTDDNTVLVRGHDAFELLAWWLKKQNVNAKFCDAQVLLALAIANASSEFLMQFRLFQLIRDWACAAGDEEHLETCNQ